MLTDPARNSAATTLPGTPSTIDGVPGRGLGLELADPIQDSGEPLAERGQRVFDARRHLGFKGDSRTERAVGDKAAAACFQCHTSRAKRDFVFSEAGK